MPSKKTECTELSVGFGLLGSDPLRALPDTVGELFQGTLSHAKFESFKTEYQSDLAEYSQFFQLGSTLRRTHPHLLNISSLRWCGPEQQASTTALPRDLEAANIPISVKDRSNVVLNPSPHNLFVSLPGGQLTASGAENWYQTSHPEGIQNLYAFVRMAMHENSLPLTFQEFDASASRTERKVVQSRIKELSGDDKREFDRLYVAMSQQISRHSSSLFNDTLESLPRIHRTSVLEALVKHFFRLDSITYILCGLEHSGGVQFAVQVPDLTAWKREWEVQRFEARPNLERKQCVVDFCATLLRKADNTTYVFPFHTEVRWSHGKFCGNPEAKLYKEFDWSAVPFLSRIV